MLNAMTGETLQPQACPDYVTHLFDNYAVSYEKHMQESLHYALPHQIARILHQFNGLQTQSHALDLGCGTGLIGSVMREISEHLTGVDLSAKMLTLAADKAIYDRLVESEILAFLKETPECYSLIIAADVVPYFGELDTLFRLIKKRLGAVDICSTDADVPRFMHGIQEIPGYRGQAAVSRPLSEFEKEEYQQPLATRGLFIFSTEISDDKPWKLQSSARFCHHETYIQALCKEYDLQLIHQETCIARTQDEHPLSVNIYVLSN
jgi:predicted TPR repeat methyltransferase